MHNTFLAFKVVIELPFPRARGLDNFVRTSGADALLVE